MVCTDYLLDMRYELCAGTCSMPVCPVCARPRVTTTIQPAPAGVGGGGWGCDTQAEFHLVTDAARNTSAKLLSISMFIAPLEHL